MNFIVFGLLQTEAALTIDAVTVITKALSKILEKEPSKFRNTFRSVIIAEMDHNINSNVSIID